MWTPKRILLLSGGFVAFFLVYLGYAYTYVGSIDGLPPLPEAFWPGNKESVSIPAAPERRDHSKLSEKLTQAFGTDAKELNWPIRLDLRLRNMVLAAADFKVMPDGRVCLTPLSVALLGKTKKDGLPPEINTIRCDVAMIKFDRPVTNFSEIGSRKVVEAELSGKIEVISNRRRPQRDEDLRVTVPTGTLYYDELKHTIWTEAYVKVEDFKARPRPHKIIGKGMMMELMTESTPQRPGQRKPNRETINGVKWITLQSSVEMELYLDGGSGLMATKSTAPAPAPVSAANASAKSASAPQKARLLIKTPGSFRYDILKDHDLAQFDVRPGGKAAPTPPQAASRPRLPQHVEVERKNLETKVDDHLLCYHLTLRLKRRENNSAQPAGKPAPPGQEPSSVEIETVHAVANPGNRVVLVANGEGLHASGTDFFHDAVKQYTVLKGAPVEVDRDDGKMRAREVRILNVKPQIKMPVRPGQPQPRAYQNVTAIGPGDIVLVDKKDKKTLRAYWQEVLTSAREGNQDLLTLVGKARFIDEQAEQTLSGDTLKVWLEEAEKKQANPRDGKTTDSRKPRHLEATGNVVARSRELNVHETGRLVVWFKDVPGVEQLPAGAGVPRIEATPQPRGGAAPTAPIPGNTPLDTTLPRPLPAGPAQPTHLTSKAAPRPGPLGMPGNGTDRKKDARPFDLSARSVEAWVLRAPDRSTLDQLWCEGSVHVKQESAVAGEKGTEVNGETMRMTAGGDGNYFLVVTGDLAELQTNKIYIIGPEVNIDQTTNKAWVIGDGAMKMDSKTNLQNEALDRPVPLTVHWSKSMLFNGDSAEFYGNIQAVQEKARMACQRLQVYFDRTISLKQGSKPDQPAEVRNLVCDREVRIEESSFEAERLVKYQRLEAPGVYMTALEHEVGMPVGSPGSRVSAKPGKSAGNVVRASGPGTIRIWEPGSGEDVAGPIDGKPTKPKKSGPAEMKMTLVSFGQRMDANSKANTAQFWSNVRVLHMPCPRHDAVVDMDAVLQNELPERSLYIRCQRLKVLDLPENGKPNKQMESHGDVYVQGKEFYARAGAMYYNQLKQQVILEGKDGENARMYKATVPGEKPQEVQAKRIIYNRATGQVDVSGTQSLTGESTPRR